MDLFFLLPMLSRHAPAMGSEHKVLQKRGTMLSRTVKSPPSRGSESQGVDFLRTELLLRALVGAPRSHSQ